MTPKELRETKSNERRWGRSAICILVAILGVGYALWLRMSGLITTEAALFGFTCLFIFVAIVVYVLPQLQELNLKELKVVLREIKETESRIYAGVDTVKQLSLLIGDSLMMHLLNFGRLYDPGFSPWVRIWQMRRLFEISKLIEATAEDERRLLRFSRLYDALDAAIGRDQSDPGREQAIKEAAQKIHDQLKQETE